ncbi:Transcription factor bHLH104 [Vitis vinifera]|uniref:Transcription factor bHLH104 n=1 Tax=Vitis vinifera TaxID=29760 RepID=A0A438GFX9_VITVI|nr:Transcription factor bHLH104 [Vitis vinifera]
MDSFDDDTWDFLNHKLIDDVTSNDLSWINDGYLAGVDIDLSRICAASQENEGRQKRAHGKFDAHTGDAMTHPPGLEPKLAYSKNCDPSFTLFGADDAFHKGQNGNCRCGRKLGREGGSFGDLFLDLSSILEPGKSAKTDKLAILGDAIRVLNQLRNEAKDLEDANEKLQEEIRSLKDLLFYSLGILRTGSRGSPQEILGLEEIHMEQPSSQHVSQVQFDEAEKNELREEKLLLKADKERIEQQMKAISAPAAGFWPTYPAATHHTGANKSAVFPSYGLFPMWQYIPSSALDTSHDHELRPPAA